MEQFFSKPTHATHGLFKVVLSVSNLNLANDKNTCLSDSQVASDGGAASGKAPDGDGGVEGAEQELEEEDFDWQIEQHPPDETPDSVSLGGPHYGFANQRSGVFTRLQVCY